jgi:hypothetical protein
VNQSDLLSTLLARIVCFDVGLGIALAEVKPRAALDLLSGLDVPDAEVTLGALLGNGWASRLFDARERSGADALLKLTLEPLGDCDA